MKKNKNNMACDNVIARSFKWPLPRRNDEAISFVRIFKGYHNIRGFTPSPIHNIVEKQCTSGISPCSYLPKHLKFKKLVMGFTLAETLMALVIGVMIMAAVVGIYSTIRNSQFSIERRLKKGFAVTEIIQRIAEDIDRLALPSSDVTLSVKNKIDIEGFKISQMVIESKFYDKDNKPQTFEKITWQSRVASDGNSLIVYRAHSGYSMEDKMLDEEKQNYERELFIPVCSGATAFAIEITDGNNITEEWNNAALPQAVRISLSFEPRQQDALGNMLVPEELIQTRIVALDRFRQIPYTFVYKTFGDPNDYDANDMNDIDVNDVNIPQDNAEANSPSQNLRKNDTRQ